MAQVTAPTFNTATGTGTLVITKPTGLSVGDDLVAHLFAFLSGAGGGAVPAFTTPTGWTLVGTTQTDTGTNSGQASFAKVADSTDVAASNFTFSITGASGTPDSRGGLIRLANNDPASAVDQSNSGKTTGTASLVSSGITPTRANSLVLILTSTSGLHTMSGYALATTNPSSWTELYDTGNASHCIAAAYGSRDVLTATGNATATANSAASPAYLHVLNVLPPAITTASMTATALAPTLPIVIPSPASLAITALAPTITSIARAFTAVTKHAGPWINRPKS